MCKDCTLQTGDCNECFEIQNVILIDKKCQCELGYFDNHLEKQCKSNQFIIILITKECHISCSYCTDPEPNSCTFCLPSTNRQLINQKCQCIEPFQEVDQVNCLKISEVYGQAFDGLEASTKDQIKSLEGLNQQAQKDEVLLVIESFTNLGIFNLLGNNQVIAQLRFVTLHSPINVYLMESLLFKSTFNGKFPEYVNLLENQTVVNTLVNNYNLSEFLNQSLEGNRFSQFTRQQYSTSFIINCYIQTAVIFFLLVIILVSICRQKQNLKTISFLQSQLVLANQTNLLQIMEELIEQKKILNSSLFGFSFRTLCFYLIAQSARFYVGIVLQLGSFQSMSVVAGSLSIVMISFYFIAFLGIHIYLFLQTRTIGKILEHLDVVNLNWDQQIQPRQYREELIIAFRNEFKPYLGLGPLDTGFQRYFWIYGLLKRLGIALTVTLLGGYWNLQLMIILLFFLVGITLKIALKYWSRNWIFMITCVGDILLCCLFILKLIEQNEYLMLNNDTTKLQNWIISGWKTIILEFSVVLLFMLSSLIKIIMVVKDICMQYCCKRRIEGTRAAPQQEGVQQNRSHQQLQNEPLTRIVNFEYCLD